MKKILTVASCLLSAVLLQAQTPKKGALSAEGDVLTFAVMSDTHFENNVGVGARVKVPRALQYLTAQGPLDALVVVGDLTDGGRQQQYEQFVAAFTADSNFVHPVGRTMFMMGNHDNYARDARRNYAEGLARFNGGERYPLDQFMFVNGFPFISISQRNTKNSDADSPSSGTGAFPEDVCQRIEGWLQTAAAECPDKPIFVFVHVPPTSTMYSSWDGEGTGDRRTANWAMHPIGAVLARYPQVVVFSGHSHYPLSDPRSIHQGVNPTSPRNNFYTAVGTGSTTYSEIEGGTVDAGIHPAGFERVTEGLIVSVKKNGDVVLRRFDTFRGEEIDPAHLWTLKAPYDGSQFCYADVRDSLDLAPGQAFRDGLPAPTWKSEASLSFSTASDEPTVSWPQATDDECVFRYRVEVRDAAGKLVETQWVFSGFFLGTAMPPTLSTTLHKTEPGQTYFVEVTAFDSFKNASADVLRGTVTAEGR